MVSAIGHEADRPILDDVADLRASTPTDAAKRIVPDVAEELARVRQAGSSCAAASPQLVDRETDRLAALRSRPVLAAPEGMVTARAEEVERLTRRSTAAISAAVVRAADQLVHLQAQVRALSPQKTLDRGYAVVQLAGGNGSGAPGLWCATLAGSARNGTFRPGRRRAVRRRHPPATRQPAGA